jgi:hypothetical protein
MMRGMRSLAVVVALVGVVAFGAAAVRGEEESGKPSGTIELSEGSVGLGIGYTWGKGVLNYKGEKHPIKITGFSAGELGAAKIQAHGTVYHLNKLSDFNGTYTSVAAGATAAGGFDVEAMRNGNGVEIKMVSTTKGADLKAAVQGVTFTVE